MREQITYAFALSLLVVLGCDQSPAKPQTPPSLPIVEENLALLTVQHYDDFSDATGSKRVFKDGESTVLVHSEGSAEKSSVCTPTKYAYPYAQLAEDGSNHIALLALEDMKSSGYDGARGLLRFEISELNGPVDHFGFVYSGSAEELRIPVKAWNDRDVTREDLDATFLEFRYRSENRTNSAHGGASFNVRLEPTHGDTWPKRIDFGVIHAKPDWQVFVSSFGGGTNLDAFLDSMAVSKPSGYKLVWGQEGPSSNYQPGDALLIDDIRITTHE